MKGILVLPITLILLFGAPATAGHDYLENFDKGMETYIVGDYATASRWFKQVAEQGDARWKGIDHPYLPQGTNRTQHSDSRLSITRFSSPENIG